MYFTTISIYLTIVVLILLSLKKYFKKYIGIKYLVQATVKEKNVWSIPGPKSIPFLGTKWIYYTKYKMEKIHEAYKGKITNLDENYIQKLIHLLH